MLGELLLYWQVRAKFRLQTRLLDRGKVVGR